MRRLADPSLLLYRAFEAVFNHGLKGNDRIIAIRRLERMKEGWSAAQGDETYWVLDKKEDERVEEIVRLVTDGTVVRLERAKPVRWAKGDKNNYHVKKIEYEWDSIKGPELEEYWALVLASNMDGKELVSWFPDVFWIEKSQKAE